MNTHLDDLIRRLEAEENAQREHLTASLGRRASHVSQDQLNRTVQRLQTLRALREKEKNRT
jgi:hypothetical protein